VGGQYFGRRKTRLCTLPISNPLCLVHKRRRRRFLHLSLTVTGVHSRDHCGLVRAGCAFLLHVCEDETQLHAQIFSPSQVFTSSSEDDCHTNFLSLLLRQSQLSKHFAIFLFFIYGLRVETNIFIFAKICLRKYTFPQAKLLSYL
jgi:hypothetical protein